MCSKVLFDFSSLYTAYCCYYSLSIIINLYTACYWYLVLFNPYQFIHFVLLILLFPFNDYYYYLSFILFYYFFGFIIIPLFIPLLHPVSYIGTASVCVCLSHLSSNSWWLTVGVYICVCLSQFFSCVDRWFLPAFTALPRLYLFVALRKHECHRYRRP